jgi:transposase-like protein
MTLAVEAASTLLAKDPRCPLCSEPMRLFVSAPRIGSNPPVEGWRCDACNEGVSRVLGNDRSSRGSHATDCDAVHGTPHGP